MASAQQDIAQASLDLALAGSPQEQIAAAAASVEQAKAALATAQAALEDSVVRAPFDGTVTNVEIDPGDTATQSDVVVVVATLDRLQAKTKDLTELDIVNVEAGQPVIVTLDALPDQPLKGHVVRIEPQSVDYRGDVTYPVFIDLDEAMPQLRWGMTALVEIEAP